MPVHDQGIDLMFGDLQAEAAAAGTYTLVLANDTEYAIYLQDRHGYFVIDIEHLEETVMAEVQALLAARAASSADGTSAKPLTSADLLSALDRAGFEEVAFLRSLVGTTADGRPAHPGNWGDVTAQLANGYRHDVSRDATADVQSASEVL